MKRLLCVYTVVFAAISLLSLLIGKTFCLIAFPILALSLILIPIITYRKGKAVLRDSMMFVVFSLLAVLIAYFVALPKVSDSQLFDGKYLRAEGSVVSVKFTTSSVIATVKCDKINDEKASSNICVIIRNIDEEIDLGTRLYFEGVAEFGDNFYSKGKECFLTVFPTRFEIKEIDDIFDRIVYAVRNKLRESANTMDNSALIKALIIGDKRDVSAETEEKFRTLGISHILAISGLHLSIIVMSIYNSVTRVGVPHVLSILISVFVLFFYMFIAGFTPSLLRASQMLIVFFLSMLIRRKKDSFTSLCFAGWCILLRSQWAMFDLGFLLSFFSTLGIITFVRPIMQRYNKHFIDKLETGVKYTKFRRRLHNAFGSFLGACATTASATIFTMPIILFTINEFSMFSAVGNLIIVPIAKYFLMFSSVAVSLSSARLVIVAYPFEFLSSITGKIMDFAVDTIFKIAPSTISVRTFYLTFGGIIAVAIVIFFFVKHKKMWSLPVATLVFVIYIPLFNLVSDGLIYNTMLIDTVTRSGAYTSIVRFKGVTYLLDQTSSASGSMGSIDDLILSDDISYVDKAVFIAFDEAFTQRAEDFLALLDVGEVTVVTDTMFDTSGIQQICTDRSIAFNLVYSNKCNISDEITVYCQGGVGTAFYIANGENSLSVYRSYSSDGFIYDAVASDILIFGGKECGIPSEISDDGHYRLHA